MKKHYFGTRKLLLENSITINVDSDIEKLESEGKDSYDSC